MSMLDKFRNLGGALSLAAGALAVGLFASAPAKAQFAFGYSYYDGNEELILSTTDGTVTLSTDGYQGWVSSSVGNVGGPDENNNYIVGPYVTSNDYFVFDISDQDIGTVTGVTLSISAFTITNDYTYKIADASSLANAGDLFDAGSPNVALYNALGAGGFGSFAIGPGDSNTTLNFALNAAAVAAINADIANGDTYFAVGGSVSSTIPEPSTWAMMVLGFAGLGFAGYRRAKASAVLAA
jgi:PEP-CTERM motif